jgi:hypothetical protein
MDLGLQLPLMQVGDVPLSLRRLEQAVDAARYFGFAAVAEAGARASGPARVARAGDGPLASPYNNPRSASRPAERRWRATCPRARDDDLLARYAEAGCQRVYLWPLGDEAPQIDLAEGL